MSVNLDVQGKCRIDVIRVVAEMLHLVVCLLSSVRRGGAVVRPTLSSRGREIRSGLTRGTL